MPKPPIAQIRSSSKSRAFVATLLLVLAGGVFAQQNPPVEAPMRVGFSSAVFIGLNMIDARNSIKALTASLAHEYDIPINSDPLIYGNVDEAERILHRHQVGAINMTTRDYWLLRQSVEFDRFLVTIRNGTPDEVYIVLASESSAITKLSDLQGKHLIVMTSLAMDLATVWLDVELAKLALPQTTAFLGRISESAKPAKVALPVFFGQADACLISSRAHATMVELNPQVGRQLHIVATSPNYITALFGFCTDLSPALKEKTLHAFSKLHSTTIGQQTLTLFQTEAISECSASAFATSLALLDEHARLCPAANASMTATLRGQRATPLQTP